MEKSSGKLVIFSGPSGSGKTTIVHHLLHTFDALQFSVSATTRPKRSNETDGKDYHFLSHDDFKKRIDAGEFVEWEEVYSGTFYGTLLSEVQKCWANNKTVVFDVDVIGGLNLKKKFPIQSMAMIIVPPSLDMLKTRLHKRETETPETLARRLGKAEEEIKLAKFFDVTLVNDTLDKSFLEAEKMVAEFLTL